MESRTQYLIIIAIIIVIGYICYIRYQSKILQNETDTETSVDDADTSTCENNLCDNGMVVMEQGSREDDKAEEMVKLNMPYLDHDNDNINCSLLPKGELFMT